MTEFRAVQVPSIFGPEMERLIRYAERVDREIADMLTPEAKARLDAAEADLTRRMLEGDPEIEEEDS